MFQTRMIRRAILVSAVCAAFTLMPGLASATQLIDVGFGANTTTGAGVIGSATDQWNNLNGTNPNPTFASANLNNNLGHPTGVTLSASANGVGGGFGNTSPNTSLTSEYAWTNTSTPVSVNLGGLFHNQNYSLYVYSVTDPCCNDQRPSSFTVAAANGGATGFVADNTTLNTWQSGQNYIELAVHASATGTLSFQLAQTLGEADLNGFQLFTSVPEPASVVMMGLGAIGLLVAGRRLKAAQKGKRGSGGATG